MGVASVAMAEGDLARTPFAHLLVYAVERRLTGAMFFTEPSGAKHVVRFERGVAVKVRPGDDLDRLGEILVEGGAIAQADLDAALGSSGLLGQTLIGAGHLDGEALGRALSDQYLRRMRRLFALPSATTYQYFDGHEELAEWGGEVVAMEPLALLLDGLRHHADRSSKFDGMVAHLMKAPLCLHPRATLAPFGLSEDEEAAVECTRDQPISFEEIVAIGVIEDQPLRRLLYALVITRQLDFGLGTLPVGVDVGVDDPREPMPTPSSGISPVGRVRIVTTSFRIGVAAPDLPGDGERAPVSPLARRRRSSPDGSNPSIPSPPSSDRGSDPTGSPLPRTEPSSERTPIPAAAAAPVSAVLPSEAALAASRDSSDEGVVIRVKGTSPVQAKDSAESPTALLALAEACLREDDRENASELCERARRADPQNHDVVALSAWLRSTAAGADLKAISVDLDEVLRADEAHTRARYYRGVLRNRLGDGPGAIRDLKRAVDLDPSFADAARELAALEPDKKKPAAPFLGRLFKR